MLDEVRLVIARINEIYQTASQHLYPEAELFRTLGPATTRVQRGASPTQLAVWVFLALVIALPLILIGVLLHNRLREEEAIEAATSEVVTQT